MNSIRHDSKMQMSVIYLPPLFVKENWNPFFVLDGFVNVFSSSNAAMNVKKYLEMRYLIILCILFTQKFAPLIVYLPQTAEILYVTK